MSTAIEHITLGKQVYLTQKELEKFDVNELGETVVRTTATGSFTFSGLKNGGKVSEVTLNSTTWTALPASALTDRNALAIQNHSGIEIKLNYDDTEPGYVGIIMTDGSERQYDITDAIVIYAKATSGNPVVNVEELS